MYTVVTVNQKAQVTERLRTIDRQVAEKVWQAYVDSRRPAHFTHIMKDGRIIKSAIKRWECL